MRASEEATPQQPSPLQRNYGKRQSDDACDHQDQDHLKHRITKRQGRRHKYHP